MAFIWMNARKIIAFCVKNHKWSGNYLFATIVILRLTYGKKVGKLNMVIMTRKKVCPFLAKKKSTWDQIILFYLYQVDNFYNTLNQGNIEK